MTDKTIPKFATEQEESEFWDANDSMDFLDDTEAVSATFVDARLPMKQISLRFDQHVIEQLKTTAHTKGIGYQTMIRLWVMERLGQEA